MGKKWEYITKTSNVFKLFFIAISQQFLLKIFKNLLLKMYIHYRNAHDYLYCIHFHYVTVLEI